MNRIAHGVLAAAALTLATSPTAAAQVEEPVEISVQSAEQGVDLSVTYRVRVAGQDSRRPANGASVTVSAVGPDGGGAEPVKLDARDTDGGYVGLQHYPTPGRWSVRVVVDSPSGALEFTQEVGNPPATTTTISVPTTTMPPVSTTVPLSVAAEEEQPGEEITAGSLVFLIAMLVVIAGFVVVLRRGRRNQLANTTVEEE